MEPVTIVLFIVSAFAHVFHHLKHKQINNVHKFKRKKAFAIKLN